MATKNDTSGLDALRGILNAATKAQDGAIWGAQDVKVKHEGKQLVLPADPVNMSYDAGIELLERIKKDEEQVYDVAELVPGAPWDAAVAVYRAMVKLYGVVSPQTTKSWFGDIPPQYVSVKCGVGREDVVMVPTGQIKLPSTESPVNIEMSIRGMVIRGQVKNRDRSRIVEIAAIAREMIQTNSVYKGKAIKLSVDPDGDLVLHQQPEFLDLTSVREDDIVHNDDVADLIRVNMFSPLKNTAACRKHKIPLKRGILMSGPYGTGKSLTARVTAKVATDNGWTFIMLSRSQGLKSALDLAKNYQPCVIFTEDVDRSADREDENVNDLVNILDGVDTKTNEIMVVLTTNFIDKIDKALLRPGRFDAVITLSNPNAKAAAALVRKYSLDLLPKDADLSEVGALLDNVSPASIREVVERAKLSMLSEDRDALTPEDLRVSAFGMKTHLDLLAKPPVDKGPKDWLWDGLGALITEKATGVDTFSIESSLDNVKTGTKSLIKMMQDVSMLAKGAANSSEKANAQSAETLKLIQGGKRI